MSMSTLRFRARGEALVSNYEALEAGIKRFVGRRFLEVKPGQFGFVPTGADDEVAYRAEYVRACKDGDLYAADAATAAACGVPFDPHFGMAPAKTIEKPKADKPA